LGLISTSRFRHDYRLWLQRYEKEREYRRKAQNIFSRIASYAHKMLPAAFGPETWRVEALYPPGFDK
jgi:hypothetical protein